MTKLGSKENPLILRVADDSKFDEIASVCDENGWHFILGYEPGEPEDLSDLERKLKPPIRNQQEKVGRNDPCSCGSGKRHKKCCGMNL